MSIDFNFNNESCATLETTFVDLCTILETSFSVPLMLVPNRFGLYGPHFNF